MRIERGDLDDPRVVALLDIHATRAIAETGRGSAHVLDIGALKGPEIGVWAQWEGQAVVGVGALRRLSADHGELKSMHTAEAHRGRGYGKAMVAHLIGEARAAGLKRVSLETGAWDYFRPAHALYAASGFEPCGPFEGYGPDPHSLFMTMVLR